MRALLDTHALLWWLSDNPPLSNATRQAIFTKNKHPAVSAWEIATKVRLGRLPGAAELVENFRAQMDQERFDLIDIPPEDALRAGLLPGPHKDPFDRMLIAQSEIQNVAIISNDAVFDSYRVRRLW